MSIVAGVTKRDDENAVKYKIDYQIRRPSINESHDIGLLHVAEPIEFSEKIKAVPLQTEPFNETDATAILTGWGVTDVKIKFHVH